MKRKTLNNDEIDLIDLFIVVWKKKLTVLSIIFIAIFLMFIYQSMTPVFYSVKTEVRSISAFEETKYHVYNSLLRKIKPIYLEKNTEDSNLEKNINRLSETQKLDKSIDNIRKEINKNADTVIIGQKFLFELFVEQLNQKSNLAKYIIKFKYIDRENYKNNLEFEEAAYQIASLIELVFINNEETNSDLPIIFIKHQTHDLDKWKRFLKLVEKEINQEIFQNINVMLNNHLNYVNTLTKFTMEDFELQSAVSDATENKYLEKRKELLKSDRYTQRVKMIYENSPLSNSEEFYAGRIISDTVKFDSLVNKSSLMKTLFITSLLALMIGIFVAMISYSIEKRR